MGFFLSLLLLMQMWQLIYSEEGKSPFSPLTLIFSVWNFLFSFQKELVFLKTFFLFFRKILLSKNFLVDKFHLKK